MFRITRDPKSGSSIQCFGKITSISRDMMPMSLDTDVLGVTAAYLAVARVYS